MAHSHHSSQRTEDLNTSIGQLNEIRENSRSIKGFLTRYILNTRTVFDCERLKRVAFGERDKSKQHKTVLLVGETGVGKSTLINAMVNYMLGVSSEDRIWCEIIETKEEQTDSQTKIVTVYDVFTEHSTFSLTAIDTPGFGSTEGLQEDLNVAESLHELFRSTDGVHEIDAVCLVVCSNTTRLTDIQLYIFDAVLSLFGNDVENNIVLFVTHAPTKPTNAIKTIKKAKVTCVKNDKGEPVYFRFDNSHCENFDDGETYNDYIVTWDLLNTTMRDFLAFTNERQAVNLKNTALVLKRRKHLTASIYNLKDQITIAEHKQNELEQTNELLQQHEKENKGKNFEWMVDEPYKEKVPIKYKWWQYGRKEATCCSVCQENCHYPGCWWVRDLSKCSVMSEGKCTVCTGKCSYTDHVKEGMMYVVKTRKVKKTLEDLKRKYEEKSGLINHIVNKIKYEKDEQERQKIKLVDECYDCIITLNELALKSDSVSILEHMDFLIEKMKETGSKDKVQKLEEIKQRAEAENQKLLRFIKRFWYK